ncbi:MAG TPA: CapA family protein [Candidatus Paceibacterota bacterium]|nr:CapA family protein [Candidatus Paceibacterota bacterium]
MHYDQELAERKKSKDIRSTTTIAFFGDMMLDRYLRLRIEESDASYPFVGLRDILNKAQYRPDHVVVNGEGPFSGDRSVTRGLAGSPLQFTFDPAWLKGVKDAGIGYVGQANNHMLDFGMDGYETSMKNITDAGLIPFGGPNNDGPVAHIPVGNATATLIAFNQFSPNLSLEDSVERLIIDIQAAEARGEFVIVFPHWGEEYVRYPTTFQRSAAERFILAGADMIIGAHPHVVQISEVIHGVPVYYSLGNFIFDQAFMQEVREGMMLSITLASDEKKNIFITEIGEISFDIRKGQALPRN